MRGHCRPAIAYRPVQSSDRRAGSELNVTVAVGGERAVFVRIPAVFPATQTPRPALAAMALCCVGGVLPDMVGQHVCNRLDNRDRVSHTRWRTTESP